MSAQAIAEIIEDNERDAEAAEAAAAEGVTADETPEPEPVPEPEPDPAPEPAALDSEKTEKALKSEATRHENALKRIYGDAFAERAFCPECLGEGFLEPWPAGAMPDEVWEAVKALSGKMDAPTYPHPHNLIRCDACDGWGMVSTGARAETTAAIVCANCDGRGYFNDKDPIHRAKLGMAPPEVVAPVVQFPNFHQQPPQQVDQLPYAPPQNWHASGKPGADEWDRWPGHPRYGINPANGGW